MALRNDSTNAPFVAMWEIDTARSAVPEDFGQDDLTMSSSVAEAIQHRGLRARLPERDRAGLHRLGGCRLRTKPGFAPHLDSRRTSFKENQMTIAYCWLDRSLSKERITAVADSRISRQLDDGSWVPMQNETIKLFRVPVRCYSMNDLDCATGTWRNPYFETELGLAFAGDCMEALSIANSFIRAVSQLVVDGPTRPRPEPSKLYQMLKDAGTHWLSSYAGSKLAQVHFLLFGYSDVDAHPWAARLMWPEPPPPNGSQFELPMRDDSIFVIGAHKEPKGHDFAQKLRRLFQNKAGKKMNVEELSKAGIEPDLERAKLLNADRMLIEDDIASLLMSAAEVTIGGTMQKLEVFPDAGGRAIVAFSRDDVGFGYDFQEVAPKLAYLSVAQRMGAAGRPKPYDEEVCPK
jgi:hypothetical protein